MFSGLPSGNRSDDPQRNDGNGFDAFKLRGAPLVIGEVSHTKGSLTLKAGGWYQFGRADVLPNLVNPPDGNWSAYGIADWQIFSDTSSSRSLSAFGRVTVMPADRNPNAFYLDGGLVLNAPFASRPNDAVGIGFGFIPLSNRGALAFDVREEQVVEVSYSAQLASFLSVQPNVQYVRQIPVADAASNGWRNALVIGLRITAQR